MTQRLILCFLTTFLLFTSGCTRPATTAPGRTAEAHVSDSGSVGFDIRPLKTENGSLTVDCTHESQGKLAKFAIEFGPTRKVESKDSNDFPMGTGEGRFLAEPGSDAAALLADLQKALEAKAIPSKIQRVKVLPFTFVNLGDNLSQAPGGGFNANPRAAAGPQLRFLLDRESKKVKCSSISTRLWGKASSPSKTLIMAT
jgi:hypothetical protein